VIDDQIDVVTRGQYVAFLRLSCLAQLFFAASFVLGELRSDGLVFTDDMEMKAVAARLPVPVAAVRAIAAGKSG